MNAVLRVAVALAAIALGGCAAFDSASVRDLTTAEVDVASRQSPPATLRIEPSSWTRHLWLACPWQG